MTPEPLVTVVIPVYNGSDYLADAIESVRAQSYPNIEIVVVNDGSDDGGATASICQNYGSQIHYIEKENGGVGSALNAGARAMRGDFFCWLSHDDQFHPLKTELQVAFALRRNNERLVLLSDWKNIGGKGKLINNKTVIDTRPHPQYGHGWRCLLRGHMNGSTMMLHRSQFDRHGYFDEGLRYVQDWDFWIRLLKDSYYFRLPFVLCVRREHESQLTNEDGRIAEDAILWRDLIEAAPESEKIWSAGSRTAFYRDMARRLKSRRNPAWQWAEEESERSLTSSMVSLLLEPGDDVGVTEATVNSLLNQDYPDIEIIVSGPAERVQQFDSAGGASASEDRPVRYLNCQGLSVAQTRKAMLAMARGEYLSFIGAGEVWSEDQLSKEIFALQQEGSLIGLRAKEGNQSNAISNLLFHRLPAAAIVEKDDVEAFEDSLSLSRALLAVQDTEGFRPPSMLSGDEHPDCEISL